MNTKKDDRSPVAAKRVTTLIKNLYELDPKEHGMRGLLSGRPRAQKQDHRAIAFEGYAVVFFPKITGIGKSKLYFYCLETLSNTPEAAKTKFMDRIAPGEKWETYANAGHRVRRIKATDQGDIPALPTEETP